MARNRASMREGPLAELFRATEAAQKQGSRGTPAPTSRRSSSCRRSRGRGAGNSADADQAGHERARARARERRERQPRAGSTRCPTSPRASSAPATAPPISRFSASSASAGPG